MDNVSLKYISKVVIDVEHEVRQASRNTDLDIIYSRTSIADTFREQIDKKPHRKPVLTHFIGPDGVRYREVFYWIRF